MKEAYTVPCAGLKSHDWAAVKAYVVQNPGCSMIAQLPQAPWKPSEIAKIKRLGGAYLRRVEGRRGASLKVLHSFLDCAAQCLSLGGHVTFVWPRYVTAWFRKEVIDFITQHSLTSILMSPFRTWTTPRTGSAPSGGCRTGCVPLPSPPCKLCQLPVDRTSQYDAPLQRQFSAAC